RSSLVPRMLWLLLLVLPCLGAPPRASPDPRPGLELVGIVGGCPVSTRRFPWQVSLRFYNMGRRLWEHVCGGSLIHPQWVLTAAHCVDLASLRVGQLRLYEDDQLAKVAEIVRHPKYNESLSVSGGGDIALLRLEVPMALSEQVQPVILPAASLRVSSRKRCWVTGWGNIKDYTPLPEPYHLQEVEVPIVGSQECDRKYQNMSFPDISERVIKEDMLCAGSRGRDSCEGDSGGPLVCLWNCTWIQVGVVSWGHSCGHADLPGIYTRVMSYVSWIHHHVPQFPGC
uniref:Mastin-like n=1 Tax=Marmota marmota marmota TaxID=9994 RepID=A0A8C5ZPP6_MARMA